MEFQVSFGVCVTSKKNGNEHFFPISLCDFNPGTPNRSSISPGQMLQLARAIVFVFFFRSYCARSRPCQSSKRCFRLAIPTYWRIGASKVESTGVVGVVIYSNDLRRNPATLRIATSRWTDMQEGTFSLSFFSDSKIFCDGKESDTAV